MNEENEWKCGVAQKYVKKTKVKEWKKDLGKGGWEKNKEKREKRKKDWEKGMKKTKERRDLGRKEPRKGKKMARGEWEKI